MGMGCFTWWSQASLVKLNCCEERRVDLMIIMIRNLITSIPNSIRGAEEVPGGVGHEGRQCWHVSGVIRYGRRPQRHQSLIRALWDYNQSVNKPDNHLKH